MCDKMCSSMPRNHKAMKNFGILALRISIGVIFIYMGYGKIFTNHEGTVGMMAKAIGPAAAGSFWAYFVGTLELVGGLMVLLGVYATYAAVWLSIIMITAMLTVHAGGKFAGYFLPLAVLGGTLALMGMGAGKYRLVKTECHCPKCKMSEMNNVGGCCGGKELSYCSKVKDYSEKECANCKVEETKN